MTTKILIDARNRVVPQSQGHCWRHYELSSSAHWAKDGEPAKDTAQAYARNYTTNPFATPIIMNLELWQPHRAVGNDWVFQPRELDKLLDTVRWVKEARPDTTVGIYAFTTIRSWVTPTTNVRMEEWFAANDQLQPLCDLVDVVYPSLYTFYDKGPDFDALWFSRYAPQNIAEARRTANGKPVVPFLWPRFHSFPDTTPRSPMPTDFVEKQIATCLKQADGCVMWDYTDWDKPDYVMTQAVTDVMKLFQADNPPTQ